MAKSEIFFFFDSADSHFIKIILDLDIFFRIGGPYSEQVSVNGIFRNSHFTVLHAWVCGQTYLLKNSKVVKLTWKMRNVLNRKKNQISDSSDFYFSNYDHFCTKNHPNFRWIFHEYSKNKYWKNQKIIFSFVSAHCASSIKMVSKLRGTGSAYPYLGQGHTWKNFHNFILFIIGIIYT